MPVSYTETDPTLLPDIRKLAQQGKTRVQIYKLLTLKGHRFTQVTLNRIIQRAGIKVEIQRKKGQFRPRPMTDAERVVIDLRSRGLGVQETARRCKMTPRQVSWLSEKHWGRIQVGRRILQERYEAQIGLKREIVAALVESPELRPYR